MQKTHQTQFHPLKVTFTLLCGPGQGVMGLTNSVLQRGRGREGQNFYSQWSVKFLSRRQNPLLPLRSL